MRQTLKNGLKALNGKHLVEGLSWRYHNRIDFVNLHPTTLGMKEFTYMARIPIMCRHLRVIGSDYMKIASGPTQKGLAWRFYEFKTKEKVKIEELGLNTHRYTIFEKVRFYEN